MRFNLLGPLEVLEDGRQVPLSGVKQRATLGFLLLHANKVVATSQLLRALWGDDAPATARKILQNAVSGLRATFASNSNGAAQGSPSLVTHSPGYLLRVEPDCVDLFRYRRLAEKGRAELAVGSWEPAARFLREALGLWRGLVLADLTEVGISWPELTALQNARLTALEDYVEAELATGRHHEVIGELEAAAEDAPARERLCGQLMLALYRCGRQADALSVYRRTRTALVEQLGLDPGRELQELERAILDHDPVLAVPTAGAFLVRAQMSSRAGKDQPGDVDEVLKGLTTTVRQEVERFGGIVRGAVGSVWMAVEL
jgi:DNA-binding SARP family transcriptional activator